MQIAALGPEAQNKFLANLDVAATEAFYVTATASVGNKKKKEHYSAHRTGLTERYSKLSDTAWHHETRSRE